MLFPLSWNQTHMRVCVGGRVEEVCCGESGISWAGPLLVLPFLRPVMFFLSQGP